MDIAKIALVFLLYAAPSKQQAHSATAKHQDKTQHDGNAPQQPPLIVKAILPERSQEETTEENNRRKAEHAVQMAQLRFSFFLLLATVAQVGTAIWQGCIYRRQAKIMRRSLAATHRNAVAAKRTADFAKQQVEAIERAERPFLLIQTRGDKNTQFWIRNCGKTPAQLLFVDPSLRMDFPVFVQEAQDWVMPWPPNYGVYYFNPEAEQINVPWIAPGGEYHFASFDESRLSEIVSPIREEITGGHRVIRIFSAIKYRGIITSESFESRCCYGWSPTRGTYLAGPKGYNEYT